MIPSDFHWREALPLTANSKIDRVALRAMAAELHAAGGAEDQQRAPVTPAEKRLAAAWADVLGIAEDRVGRTDHFFDSGGSSLLAVKLVVALDRAVTLEDVTRHPTLADLAGVLDAASAGSSPAAGPAHPRMAGRTGRTREGGARCL
jgi:hypothetical protein